MDHLKGIRTLRRHTLSPSPLPLTQSLIKAKAMNSAAPAAAPPPPPAQAQAQAQAEAHRYSFSPTLKWDPHVQAYFSHAYGADHFARISSALTRPSCYSSIRVNTLKAATHDVRLRLLQLLQQAGAGEETFIPQIHPALHNVLFVRGTGPHEVCYHSHHAGPFKEVIVSRKCAEAVLRGAQIFVPGVMACSAHVEKGDKVAVSVAIEKPTDNGGWTLGITRGTVLHGVPSGKDHFVIFKFCVWSG